MGKVKTIRKESIRSNFIKEILIEKTCKTVNSFDFVFLRFTCLRCHPFRHSIRQPVYVFPLKLLYNVNWWCVDADEKEEEQKKTCQKRPLFWCYRKMLNLTYWQPYKYPYIPFFLTQHIRWNVNKICLDIAYMTQAKGTKHSSAYRGNEEKIDYLICRKTLWKKYHQTYHRVTKNLPALNVGCRRKRKNKNT